jgi:phospholipid N-methyltransferase
MRGDHALFFGLWLQKPLQIAAITPGSATFVAPCLARLGPGGRFLQMTNAFSSRIAIAPLGIAGARVAYVWRNLPPAQVWAYSARAGNAGEIAGEIE